MKTIHPKPRYVEWLSPEEMHHGSQEWLSELRFIKDEHLFFEDLINTYTMQLISSERIMHNKEVIDAINKSQKRNGLLIKAIINHINKLEIMVDGIDQPTEEEAYKKEHRRLIIAVSEYLKSYRKLKSRLFENLKYILKKQKQRLIDKE